MTTATIAIAQNYVTVNRKVIHDVVTSLIAQTRFSDNAELIYQEQLGAPRNPRNWHTPCSAPIKTEYSDYVFIEHEQKFTENDAMRDRTKVAGHAPLFSDEALGINVRPIYAEARVEMSLRFRTKSLTRLNAWVNTIRVNGGIQFLIEYHNLDYDYSMPKSILNFIVHAHTLRENVSGYGETIADYTKARFSKSVTTRSNMAEGENKHTEIICRELQEGVQGMVMDEMFYNVTTVESGLYECVIPYAFNFSAPLAVQIEYPLFIHNQFIDPGFIKMWTSARGPRNTKIRTPADNFLKEEQAEADAFCRYYRGDGGTRELEHDSWFPKYKPWGTKTLTIIPVQVDPNDTKAVFNLAELKSTELLPKAVYAFMEAHYEIAGRHGLEMLNFEIHEVGEEELRLALDIDESLEMRTAADMDIRNRHYLRISLLEDWSTIGHTKITPLLSQPELLFGLGKILDPDLTMGDKDSKWKLVGNKITEMSYMSWLKSLSYVNDAFRNNVNGPARTAMLTSITTKGVKNA